ncbi:arrestin domain-containing protein 3 isoform X2 [Ptiloglossa arizonensis]|uniref:arrestin domain-containing protein 3 isoform X2 n=1 Tax=Ptiloglossa arizonensis TaxID=3350558 RepID=UPI003F9FD80B
MPSLKTFRVEFERPSATYVAGETVHGNIVLEASSEKSVRGLYFTAKGEACVRWTETESGPNNESQEITYSNFQSYFNFQASILRANSKNSRVHIPVGYQRYTFQFQLPNNIPSSFEHRYGHVRYTVKAVLDRPWKFDQECKTAFTVVSILDLNTERHKCLGIDDEAYKNFYTCCCETGSVNVGVRIPSSGYVPGQMIVTALNYALSSSSITITGISSRLNQELKFHASTGRTKSIITETASTKSSGQLAASGQAISELRVPPLPPSSLDFCSIIDLNYKLQVCVHVSGAHFKFVKSYPILIGSVPLYCSPTASSLVAMTSPVVTPATIVTKSMSAEANYPLNNGATDAPPLPLGFVHPDQTVGTSNDCPIPPPSYEECMSGAEHIKDHDESDFVRGANTPFAPRYPVFNYPTLSVPKI